MVPDNGSVLQKRGENVELLVAWLLELGKNRTKIRISSHASRRGSRLELRLRMKSLIESFHLCEMAWSQAKKRLLRSKTWLVMDGLERGSRGGNGDPHSVLTR